MGDLSEGAVEVVLRQMQKECDAAYERLATWAGTRNPLGFELRVVEPGPDRLTVLAFSRGKQPEEASPGTQVGIFRYYAGPAEALEGDRMYAGGVFAPYLGEDPKEANLTAAVEAVTSHHEVAYTQKPAEEPDHE